MGKPSLLMLPITLLLSLTLLTIAATATATAPATAQSDFIKQQCNATSFPDLCVQSLSVFASRINQSPRQLAQTSLTVSLSRARKAKAQVAQLNRGKGLQPKIKAALKDCAEEMGDLVDRLGKSSKELHRAGRADAYERKWRISNVQTWVSAGITDENTCLDGFSGRPFVGKVEDSVRACVLDAVHCTSNSLALINMYANAS